MRCDPKLAFKTPMAVKKMTAAEYKAWVERGVFPARLRGESEGKK